MKITFLPTLKQIQASSGDNLLKIAEDTGILIDASCGGTMKCGKCKVKITKGETGPLTTTEKHLLSDFEIRNGYRLACCLEITSDLEVYVPNSHGGFTQKKQMTNLPEDFVPEIRITSTPCYGVAFDIGTTTVVGMLWNLKSNTLVDVEARTNYQSVHGSDVISRIQFCNQEDSHTALMHKKVILCFNDILEDIFVRNQILPQHVYDVTIVGNTTMSHLVLGVHPKSLARTPFVPVFCDAQNLTAHELGIKVNPRANVFLLPNIAGHVGSDIVGMMLATHIYKLDGCHIAIDIGTNGEIVAIKDGKLLTCSTAAGPAFEGASIHHGMRAAAGAIETVSIQGNQVSIQTIDNAAPIGICGSGLIDAVAELLNTGIIEPNGRMLTYQEAITKGIPVKLAKRIISFEQQPAFILTYPQSMPLSALSETSACCDFEHVILLTQQDIRKVQLAKGAILAGMQTLMKTLSMTENDIDTIMLAGAFGNYIDKKSALRIGLFPQIMEEKIISVGNAAGTGASMGLFSASERQTASEFGKKTEHIELSMNMDFQEFYMYAMTFPC